MKIKKQDLMELDLKSISSMTVVELEEFCQENKLSHFHTWLLPQMVAFFGSWTLKYSTSNTIDVLATLKHNVQTKETEAIWKLTRIKRSALIPVMNRSPEYGTLSPLVLMGFRKMQGIPYSSWTGLENLEWILEPRLLEAVALVDEDLQIIRSLGSDRLVEIRDQGLTQRSGEKAGQKKRPESTWSLTGIQDTEIGHLPKLTQSMLCQVWLAHPSLRSPYMIVDPLNWDNQPKPLVVNEIFITPEKAKPASKPITPTPFDLPWNL